MPSRLFDWAILKSSFNPSRQPLALKGLKKIKRKNEGAVVESFHCMHLPVGTCKSSTYQTCLLPWFFTLFPRHPIPYSKVISLNRFVFYHLLHLLSPILAYRYDPFPFTSTQAAHCRSTQYGHPQPIDVLRSCLELVFDFYFLFFFLPEACQCSLLSARIYALCQFLLSNH